MRIDICFRLHLLDAFYHYGKNCPSRKGIQTFMTLIPSVGFASVSNSCICTIKNYDVKIDFKLKI